MGEVGANATETTASEQLKENGELNGVTTLAGEAATATGTDAAAILLQKTKKVVDSKGIENASNADDDGGAEEGKEKLDGDRQPNDSAVEQTEKVNDEDGQAAEKSSTATPSSEKKANADDAGNDENDEDGSADAQQARGTTSQKETSKQTTSKRQRSNSRSSSAEKDDTTSKIQKKQQQAGGTESSNGSVNGDGVSGPSQSDDKQADRRRPEKETTDGGGDGVIDLDLDDTIPEEEEEEEPMEVDESPVKEVKTSGGGAEGQPNGKSREEDRNQSKAPVVAVARTKEGEKDNGSSTVSSTTVTNGHQKASEPSTTITAAKSTVDGARSTEEPMEQDEEEDDDDKPVSINSDSDGEEQQQPKPKVNEPAKNEEVGKGSTGEGAGGVFNPTAVAANGVVANAASRQLQNGDCDGDVTILSDKEEDCVVIEDDDMDGEDGGAPAPPPTATTPLSLIASRRSKSRRSAIAPPSPVVAITPVGMAAAQHQQQHTSGHHHASTDDEDDDDIQEIIEDPLSTSIPMAHSRGSGSLTMGSPIGSAGGFTAAGAYKPQKSLLMNSTGKDQPPKLLLIDTMDGGLAAAGRASVGGLTGNSVSLLAGSKTHNSSLSGGSMATVGMSTVGQNVPFNATTLGNSRSLLNSTTGGTAGAFQKNAPTSLAPVTPLLPALTDDMFVLEAPSFIVPYIYEKPPVDNLRDIVDDLEAKIKEMRKKLEEETGVSGGSSVEQKTVAAATAAAESATAAEDASKKDAAGAALDPNEQKDSTADSKKRKRPVNDDDDDEWDELDTSTDDEASDEEQKTKVLIKEAKADIETIKEHIISPNEKDDSGTGGTGSGGAGGDASKKSENYFENPLGKFFMNIGINLVQEFVQTDLLRQQKRKRDREGKPSPSTQLAINSLMKNLEQSKENNKPYKFEMKRCEYCPFRSESALVMAHHYETPHMRNFIYKCNFCSYETRPPHDILYHMEAVHNIKGRMEKALSYHHCPNCPFEDNGKSKLARHAVACAKKFRPEINLNPPMDWEPPAKIPRIKPKHGLVGTATAYQAMTAQQQKNLALANQQRINQVQQHQTVQHLTQQQQQQLTAHQLQQQQQSLQSLTAAQQQQLVSAGLTGVNLANLSPAAVAQAAALRGRMVGGNIGAGIGGTGMTGGRAPSIISSPTGISSAGANVGMRGNGGAGGLGNVGVNAAAAAVAASAALRNTLVGAGMVIPNNLQLSASALAAAAAAGGFTKYAPNSISAGRSLLANTNASITIQNATGMKSTKAAAQPPSISITPLPRQSSSNNSNAAAASLTNIAGALSKLQSQGTSAVKPGQSPTGGGKTAFVVCEICDGYIKDLDQLRNHMQWIHKVKIHPKMIYNRPPLNCQKCQYRFFTDQGLERHLLGSHGLVTSSMQEAANKGKDAGRCPVCGRVYQWKLLNHVSRDHNMTLKPAHLSYKCTVCTATFGMYKQFESHVYSAHSTVAKKSVDGKSKGGGGGGGGGGGSGMQQSATNLSTTGDRSGATSSRSGGSGGGFVGSSDSLLKPLKINDEITIIPQPSSNKLVKTIDLDSHVID